MKNLLYRMAASWGLAVLAGSAVIVLLAACGGTGAAPSHDNTKLQQTLQIMLQDFVKSDDVMTGASIYVIAPHLDLEWGTAIGVTERGGSVPLTPEHPTYISSVTKSFVAAAILRLHEEDRIDIEAPITRYLREDHLQILKDGGYDVDQITVRHLLMHTSGLADFFYTKTFDQMAPKLMSGELVHLFTLEEQLRMAMEDKSYGKPGEVYHYSDTGYILLGAMLEKITGKSMAAATRELVDYDNLGLKNTWWAVLEPRPVGVLPRAHQYYGDYDSYNNDPPFDLYGGGGMISTPEDMARFFQALFKGGVYAKEDTLDLMLTTLKDKGPKPEDFNGRTTPDYYGLGIFRGQAGDIMTYGHGGWWGAYGFYVPSLDIAIGVTTTRQEYSKTIEGFSSTLLEKIQAACRPLSAKSPSDP
ncbi:serine hydrolase domain-containing protein [Paremcibacter congregatus]|nr:serine hydrolase domain-containing protein [Paremcibacter congregatus]